jgi:hypothetical protein
VFYPTYNLWLSSSSQSYILFEVIAFQSGFFWQALFTKAKPLRPGRQHSLDGQPRLWACTHWLSPRRKPATVRPPAG